jgi:hypothetical protein
MLAKELKVDARFMVTYVKRHIANIFREGLIEGGSGMRLASTLERGHFSEKEEGGEMSAIYYTER